MDRPFVCGMHKRLLGIFSVCVAARVSMRDASLSRRFSNHAECFVVVPFRENPRFSSLIFHASTPPPRPPRCTFSPNNRRPPLSIAFFCARISHGNLFQKSIQDVQSRRGGVLAIGGGVYAFRLFSTEPATSRGREVAGPVAFGRKPGEEAVPRRRRRASGWRRCCRECSARSLWSLLCLLLRVLLLLLGAVLSGSCFWVAVFLLFDSLCCWCRRRFWWLVYVLWVLQQHTCALLRM